jgi:hypothetical protein
MIASIHQPNFLPWIGLFHKISLSDVFIAFDDVQFPVGKNFGSRVLIRNFNNSFWVNIPVEKRSELPAFNKVRIREDGMWKKKLLKKIEFSYGKSEYFKDYFPFFSDLIIEEREILSEFNLNIIKKISERLGLRAKIIRSSEIDEAGGKNGFDKIIALLKKVNADVYISGRGKGSAKYINDDAMSEAGIRLEWQVFNHPVYRQVGNGFIENLSVIDLLFNEGPKSFEIIKSSGI